MGPSLAYTYRYAAESRLSGGPRPELRLVTSGGTAEHPAFFRGFLLQPRLTAELLRGLSRIVGARFYVPPQMVAKILRQADPVVTSGGGMLRFEGFSACASAHARVDLSPGAYEGEVVGKGTTNVDFNAPMRAALAAVQDGDRVGLRVGLDEVALERSAGAVVERKVDLPVRWLKSFVEVQAYQARMKPRLELSGVEALRFLRGLPRAKTSRHTVYLVPSGRSLRLSMTKVAGAVSTSGTERLRCLEDLARFARALRIYADRDDQATGWELDFGALRFTLSLSAETSRGFSGEGQALEHLAASAGATVATARSALAWQAELRAADLAKRLKTTPEGATRALAILGSRGLVGFDCGMQSYFHRELPFDLGLIDALAPRLKAAKTLVAEQRCTVVGAAEVHVRSSGVVYRVRLDDGEARCTCPWFGKHQGKRGPCKHALAAQMALEGAGEGP